MLRVYVADSVSKERSVLRLLLLDLKMEVVGFSSDWSTTLTLAPPSELDMLLVDRDLLPEKPEIALAALREACPNPVFIVLVSRWNADKKAEPPSGVYAVISKNETREFVATRLQAVAKQIAHEFTLWH
jgi:hypothetical protein